MRKRINIVFVCHRPNVWTSLKTVFEACNEDARFKVTIVAIPNKVQLPKLGLLHEMYESEGAEEFFANFPCRVINGYDYVQNKWFNIKKLKPDYVFFQTPYNICRPRVYNSAVVTKYAKLLYVHYAANIIGGGVHEETYPRDFLKDLYAIYTQDEYDDQTIKQDLNNFKVHLKTYLTGFPRYDYVKQYRGKESSNWNFPRNPHIKRVIWTPRWSTAENNCHFFDYKDVLLSYVETHKNIDFIFRPHPQAFLEWAATGELPENEAQNYKAQYNKLENAKVDFQKEYLSTFYSSDILITDVSSIIADYFLTEKPVVYCHKTDCFNNFSRKLSEGFYWVRNWGELKRTIDMLCAGEDPLYERRQQIIKEAYYINEHGAGRTIKNMIKKDFYGQD